MSMLIISLTSASGTVGFESQCFEPFSPDSSASQKATRIECFGLRVQFGAGSATSNSVATPLALSSAPLWM